MRKIIRVLVLALLCVVPLLAQDEFDAHLVGHVLDEKTGEHLPYVNVQVKGTNIGTVTDESGHYFLKNLPIGRQTIVFSYLGYETEELPVNITEHTTTELKAAIREVPHLAGYILRDEETLAPSFWDLGIRLAYDVHLYKHYCLEISCGVKNVLDQYQRDIDKGEFRDASYIYGPSMPRTYFVGLTLKI